MGKRGKSARAVKRKLEKQALKAARKQLYHSYAEQGRKIGTKRSRKTAAAVKIKHSVLNCGNPGCNRCFPQFIRVPKGKNTGARK